MMAEVNIKDSSTDIGRQVTLTCSICQKPNSDKNTKSDKPVKLYYCFTDSWLKF